jgi:hypothetical protein
MVIVTVCVDDLLIFALSDKLMCKGNLMISTNHMILARENQRSIKNKIYKLTTHVARENQREKSKVFPEEGATIYSQLCDKVKGISPHWEVNPLR